MATNVLQLLEKINRTAQRINAPGLSRLEYDLLMQYVRDLYDELHTLRSGTIAATKAELPVVNVAEQQRTEVQVTYKEMAEQDRLVEQVVVPVSKPVEQVQQQPVVKHEPVVYVKHEPVVVEEERTEPVVVLVDEPVLAHTPITDMVEHAVPINERIKSSGDLNERWKGAANEVHHKYAVKPLKDMIDLNRRIAFVNDLFKGNSEELSKAVQTIDTATDYEVAKVYVNSLAKTWNWFESSQSAKLFVKLVKQRFGEE